MLNNGIIILYYINRPVKPHENITIDNEGPYWQIFWHHLSIDQQRVTRALYPDLIFPPQWLHCVSPGHHTHPTGG